MARNKYAGYCCYCGRWIESGLGYLERYRGECGIKCVKCRTMRDVDKDVVRVRKELEDGRKEM